MLLTYGCICTTSRRHHGLAFVLFWAKTPTAEQPSHLSVRPPTVVRWGKGGDKGEGGGWHRQAVAQSTLPRAPHPVEQQQLGDELEEVEPLVKSAVTPGEEADPPRGWLRESERGRRADPNLQVCPCQLWRIRPIFCCMCTCVDCLCPTGCF